MAVRFASFHSLDQLRDAPSTEVEQVNTSRPVVSNFMKELAHINEQKSFYNAKIDQEKKRHDKLSENIQILKSRIRQQHETISTRNQTTIKSDSYHSKRKVEVLEKGLARIKVKFGTIRTNNISMRDKITNQRQEKQMRLNVAVDVMKDIETYQRKIQDMKAELKLIAQKRSQIRSENYKMKNRILNETEAFTREVELTKDQLFETQESIISTIREKSFSISQSISKQNQSEWLYTSSVYDSLINPGNKLPNTISPTKWKLQLSNINSPNISVIYPSSPTMGTTTNHLDSSPNSPATLNSSLNKFPTSTFLQKIDIQKLIDDSGCENIDEFLEKMETLEQHTFESYNNIQKLHEELEKIEQENRGYEEKVKQQVQQIEKIEETNSKIRNELEQEVDAIQTAIVIHERKFGDRMEILNLISESLGLLLKNVGREDSLQDKKLLAMGLSDRNIEEYLSLLESRIDDIIQMSKAAAKKALTKSDFVQEVIPEKRHGGYAVASLTNTGAITAALMLPSLAEDEASVGSERSGRSTVAKPVNIATLKGYMEKRIAAKPLPIKTTQQGNLKVTF